MVARVRFSQVRKIAGIACAQDYYEIRLITGNVVFQSKQFRSGREVKQAAAYWKNLILNTFNPNDAQLNFQ